MSDEQRRDDGFPWETYRREQEGTAASGQDASSSPADAFEPAQESQGKADSTAGSSADGQPSGYEWYTTKYDPNGSEDEGQAGVRPEAHTRKEAPDYTSASGQEASYAERESENGRTGTKYNPKQYGYTGYDHREGDGRVNFGGSPSGGNGRPPKKPKKNHNAGLIAAVIAGVAAIGIVFFLIIAALWGFRSSGTSTASSSSAADSNESEIVLGGKDDASSSDSAGSSISSISPDDIKDSADGSDGTTLTVTSVVKAVMPSMVAITNTSVTEYQNMFGETYDQESVSAGSGIIVGETDDHLLIATNNHVISGSSDITVTFVDDQAIAGTVQGADADYDLAIVSVSKADIPQSTQDAIAIVTIGDSDSVEVGESVVAIGNALGYGQSVSAGIVSAVNRTITDTDGTERTMIQTDASINPGNSGGALLNMKGELIGINEAKQVDESVEGVGYAIPTAIAEPILKQLGSKAIRDKVSDENASYLGITCVTVPSTYTQNGYPEGVYVASVVSGGPADEAGIRQGDIITAFDGSTVATQEALLTALEYYAAGEQAEISISRINDDQTGFTKKRYTVTLGSKADADLSSDTADSTAAQSSADTGSENGGGLFGVFGN
jgi:serine protease Do